MSSHLIKQRNDMHQNKMYTIQILRGIAALSVVFSHSSHKLAQTKLFTSDFFSFAGFGVDIFFMISGFIMMFITGVDAKDNKNRNILSFFKDRIIRIIPLYWFFTILSLAIFCIMPGSINSSGGDTGILQSFILLPVPNGTKFLIQNGWTLTYEFLFYFAFSFFLVRTDREKLIFVLLTFLAIDVSSSFFGLQSFASYSIKYEFILGIGLYLFFKKDYLYAVLAFLLAYSIAFFNTGLGGRVLNEGLHAFILVLMFLVVENKFSWKGPVSLFLLFLGDISFSLYLSHPFVIQGISILNSHLSLNVYVVFVLMVLCSIIFGYLIYTLLEKKMVSFFKNKKLKKVTV
ncbi:acyltransferase family protein [Erwinia sp. E602]|nr:acyltransferase family protein [Erwinia sp. E602]